MLGAVSLDSASEGRKEKLWTDPERYPTIAETELVSFLMTIIVALTLFRLFNMLKLS